MKNSFKTAHMGSDLFVLASSDTIVQFTAASIVVLQYKCQHRSARCCLVPFSPNLSGILRFQHCFYRLLIKLTYYFQEHQTTVLQRHSGNTIQINYWGNKSVKQATTLIIVHNGSQNSCQSSCTQNYIYDQIQLSCSSRETIQNTL